MSNVAIPLSWLEISQSALHHNVRALRGLVGPTVQLFPCVKANAYGHGLKGMEKLWREAGADGFSVAEFEEAMILRSQGIMKPIQVMSPLPIGDVSAAAGHDLWVWVHSLEDVQRLASRLAGCKERLQVVAKVDTGMGRLGVAMAELERMLRLIKEKSQLNLVSVATHFATADLGDDLFWQQKANFACVEQMTTSIFGCDTLRFQSANSAAILQASASCGELVRPGLAIYGYWPATALDRLAERAQVSLQPALSWKTRLVQIKELPAGANVGYGGKTSVQRGTKLGIIPLGYGQGLDRRLSNQGKVLIGGKEAPVLGNVCMNVTMLDLSEVDHAQVGDEVVLLGKQGDVQQTAEDWAQATGKIVYEVLVNLSPLLERRVIE